MSLPFKPLGDRVVIKADRDDHAPETTDSGLVIAKTLAAAVEGSDPEDHWFVGTVVGLGPLVNRFDVRPYVLARLKTLDIEEEHVSRAVNALIADVMALPADYPDPVQIGDRVIFSWASGQQVTVDGDKFLIMKATDILGILEPESEAQ